MVIQAAVQARKSKPLLLTWLRLAAVFRNVSTSSVTTASSLANAAHSIQGRLLTVQARTGFPAAAAARRKRAPRGPARTR